MGILDTLNSIVGKGSPTLAIELKSESIKREEYLKGIVHIKGGAYDCTLDGLDFYIIQKETIQKDGKESVKSSEDEVNRISYEGYKLEKEEVISIPFGFKIPSDTPLTSEIISNFIRVELDISGKNSEAIASIKISNS